MTTQQDETVAAVLALTGIVKLYPGVCALDQVDLVIEAGQVHAVLGENGAGKSTLVGVAAGSVTPDAGTVALLGTEHRSMTPALAREHGLALVYQTPALAASLTVTESMLLLLPKDVRPPVAGARAWTQTHLDSLGLRIDASLRIAELTPREAHLVEIAAALATNPRVLVLDEPTEALGPDETRWLFAQIRRLTREGVAVVYITHRIPEIREIADQMIVLRDGRVVGRGAISEFSDDQIVELIVGRSLDTTFPVKGAPVGVLMSFDDLSGTGFSGVCGQVRAGEILGLAGVEGNGQRQFLRALAGLERSSGRATVGGAAVSLSSPATCARQGIVFLSGDRLHEAMFGQLSVRENVAALRLSDVATGRTFLRLRRERRLVGSAVTDLRVKAPSFETPVDSLSGGNQQKVLLARAALENPTVLLVEDPTQGVDAGARLEIYRALRELAAAGSAIVVVSTDALELEGLCDRVLVFSRGRVQATLEFDTLSERHITGAAVLSTETDIEQAVPARQRQRRWSLPERQALAVLVLALVVGALTAVHSSAFLGSLNIAEILAATSSLALVGLAQLIVVLTGGIDLSVGSVIAVSVVTVSFFAGGPPVLFLVGVLVAVIAGVIVGLVNGVLVTRLSMPPVVATLVTSIGVLGIAQLLRSTPGGQASDDLLSELGTTVAGVPLVFVAALVIGVAGHVVLRRAQIGRALRATGSDATQAARMGVNTAFTRVVAYEVAGAFAALAGVALFSQTGVGDSSVGQALTLTSITAVVLGGASVFGGSGSALATVATALFLETITSSLNFLDLSLAWQYWAQAILVVAATLVPLLRTRRLRRTVINVNTF